MRWEGVERKGVVDEFVVIEVAFVCREGRREEDGGVMREAAKVME